MGISWSKRHHRHENQHHHQPPPLPRPHSSSEPPSSITPTPSISTSSQPQPQPQPQPPSPPHGYNPVPQPPPSYDFSANAPYSTPQPPPPPPPQYPYPAHPPRPLPPPLPPYNYSYNNSNYYTRPFNMVTQYSNYRPYYVPPISGWGPPAAQPPPVQPAPYVDHQSAKKIKNDVNVHKDTIRLQLDELKPDCHLVSFTFDAMVDGRAKENINTLHAEIVSDLKEMLDEHNILVKTFRTAKEFLVEEEPSNVRLRLVGRRGRDAHRYNMPVASEVAALVVGDFDECMGDRDIVVETRSGLLKRINELNVAYLALQYPLLFPYGEDGYREEIPLSVESSSVGCGRKRVSIREWFAYRLHEREHEPPSILISGRLTQQFVVDAYTMVESARLTYVKTHQKQLRCELYKGLTEALLRGENDLRAMGTRIILPPTFTGGARYMIQNYQDAMAICRWAGYPDLFITFTCNPKWSEIVRFLKKSGCKAEDRLDIICRVFKIKLDELIRDLRKNKIFGTVRATVYTFEFQKRGLPHAHILLFLASGDKYPTPGDINRIISAEIPDQQSDPDYYNVVRDFMMHDPCGVARPKSPCMSENRCTKHFPKKFVESTNVDEDGYPVYRRRNDGRTVVKNEIELDNRYVVPHNRYLLLKYDAHLNVEWCNQSSSIKYLFKYVNKGHDRVTASFYKSANEDGTISNNDEISMYNDCRYISPCEAMWRILGYEIQYRDPPVERLSFHLPDEQCIIFSDSDPIDVVLERPSVNGSMFLAWFEANGRYKEDGFDI